MAHADRKTEGHRGIKTERLKEKNTRKIERQERQKDKKYRTDRRTRKTESQDRQKN